MGQSSQNFPHLQSTTGFVKPAKNFERIAKEPGIFALVHAKASTMYTSGVKDQG